ncbi:hypothetical protein C0992_010197 [Termitomyces sp. T32_za158]|nr:hypothetical protein C0992_010197 [Termitomyces sp. T32_za158]
MPAPFKEGDFVYVSTENMTFPKGLARKLIPKFVGPYLLLKDFGNHSFCIQLPAHMRQRGIHNSFHASLLRIHYPNNDRRFPGRLYSQIVANVEPNHVDEWPADKIISHAGSKSTAIFEVLWRAGDKTWLPYNQVQELDILSPYLEAQGVENIHELPTSSGKPPTNDPQVFLGSLQFLPINTPQFRQDLHPPAHLDILREQCLHLTPKLFLMSYRPKNHYTSHPCLAVRPDGFLQLTATEPHITIHPAQLLGFLDFNNAVRRRSATTHESEPAGYKAFAKIYNTTKGDNPCEFILCNAITGDWNYDGFPIPRSILTFPILNNCFVEFCAFGIINEKGDINRDAWASMKNALLCPHRKAVRNQARSESRCKEKEHKRCRIADAHLEGFKLPSLNKKK